MLSRDDIVRNGWRDVGGDSFVHNSLSGKGKEIGAIESDPPHHAYKCKMSTTGRGYISIAGASLEGYDRRAN